MATLKSLLFSFILLFFVSHSSFSQVWIKKAKSGNAGLLDVVFISKSTGFVLASDKVLRTTDTGKTWNRILSGYTDFSKIQFIDNQNGFIIGKNDLVLRTTDGGSNWSLKRTGNSDDDLVGIFAKDNDTVFVAGPDNIDNNDSVNYIQYSYNGGNSWARRNLNTKQPISSVNMWDRNKGFITSKNGIIFQTGNGFTNINTNSSVSLRIMDSKIIKDSIIVLVGDSGKIARSTDYGKTFKIITSPSKENLAGLHFANDSFGMVCGAKGTILFTLNSGASWAEMNTNTSLNFTKVFVINPYLAWAVAYSTSGDSIDIFKYEDKRCISRFVKLPRDTVICDKYDYETPFITEGVNKPKWSVNDALTNLYQLNDSVAFIDGMHEGKFIISFELQSCEEILRDTAVVYIWRNPNIKVKDSLYCGSVNDNISFSCFACTFLWSNMSDAYNFVATQPGKYWVTVSNYCKTISDTFTLSYLPYLKLDLGKDTLLCNNESLTLKNTLLLGKYLWNDADTSSIKTLSKPGNYSVVFENKCNILNDSITLVYKKTPTLDLGKDSIYCLSVNHLINLDSVKNNSAIKWNDGNTLYNRSLDKPGKYSANISNECGLASDTVNLDILFAPKLNLGKDTIYCQNFKHLVNLEPQTKEYLIEWWDGKDSITRNFSSTGDFAVKVYNRCGELRDTLKIERKAKPLANLGKDTIVSKPFIITLDAKNAGCTYLWNTGSSSQTITVNEYGVYSVVISNYCGTSFDSVTIAKPLSIASIKNNAIKVYPNPIVEGMITVENFEGNFEIELFDPLGNCIIKKQVESGKQVLDLGSLNKGVYYLKIFNNGLNSETFQLIKL